MQFQFLNYRIEDYIAVLTINRPPVNALNRELVAEIRLSAEQVATDVIESKVRAVIIKAEGKYFCAGADLKERMGMREEEVGPTVRNTSAAMEKIAQIPVPTIAALHGSAMGGGFEVALSADIRIVANTAQLGLRETALAIIPGAGGTQRLTRLVGPSNAILWITTARLFTAEEALQQGAVNFVTSEGDLMSKAWEIASEIAKNGPLAVQQAKKAILTGIAKSLETGLEIEHACYERIIPTRDRREGLQAFKEKRSPDYKGQ